MTRPICPEPPNPPAPQAKSSLKIKSKVADSGRSKVDLPTEASPASSFSFTSNPPQLEIDKLPDFNFSSVIPVAPSTGPAPIKQSSEKPSDIEIKAPSPPPARSTPSISPIPPEVLERNNNDKSPNKRLSNEADDQLSSETKKVKSVERNSSPPTSKSVEAAPVQADIIPRRDLAKSFDFSLPQYVIESSEIEVLAVTEAHRRYNFSAPSPVQAGLNSEIKKSINGPSKPSDSSLRLVAAQNLPLGG